ncbi:MAG TPA: hypothetical protein VKC56_05525 [Gallionellaceae bacterium]|nr:hypothetical protein [Gallionellaceae bacterium]
MAKTTQATAAQPDDSAITLSLSEAQLKALGLNKLPAPGAEVQLRATAKVTAPGKAASPVKTSSPAKADSASDTDHDGDQDGDQDAGDYAQGGDTDADGAEQGGTGEDRKTAALTLHLTGLTLTQPHKAPDKVLYGSGD